MDPKGKHNLIPNVFIRWHFDALGAHPMREALLREIPDSVFHQTGRELSANHYASLLKRSFAACEDESFGALSLPLKPGCFRMMTMAAISAADLQGALHRMIDFYALVSDEMKWTLVEDDDLACLALSLPPALDANGYFRAFMVCVIWRWLSWNIDKPIALRRLQLSHAPVACQHDIGKVFKLEIAFAQGDCRLYFDAHLLKSKIKQTPESLKGFLIDAPECLLSHYQEDLSLSRRIRRYMEELDDLSRATLPHIAAEFHLSEQSLMRKLKREGTRFSEIRDKVRKHNAEHWLSKTNLCFDEISARLGYAETSVFYRNMKKWFAQTPAQYRQLRN